jgi:hypothetical protein
MPRLTPAELQEARLRSGKLGGRPRKPTVDEARSDALERLVPKAIRVLEEYLDSGRPDAWRPAARVLDHAWGRPPEHVVAHEVAVPRTVAEIEQMSTADLIELVQQKRTRAVASDLPGEIGVRDGSGASAAVEVGG